MTAPVWVILLIAACLALVGGSISAGDRSVLVGTPEAVAEDFVRRLLLGRYDIAHEDLSEQARRAITADSLERFAHGLRELAGEVEEVRGERQVSGDETAVASVDLKATKREIRLDWALVWESGQWALDGRCDSDAIACALVSDSTLKTSPK